MFLIQGKLPEKPSRELSIMIKKLNKAFGTIPPHFKLLGVIDPDTLEETLRYLFKLMNHKRINPDLFTFIRYRVAKIEGYDYCINFNHSILKAKGYSEENISKAGKDISKLPLESKEQILASKAIKAIYRPKDFNKNDLSNLYDLGWNNKDIFEVINHAGFLLKNGRIISCYLNKTFI